MSAKLVDASTVAAELGVETSWVRQHTRDGNIPFVQLGRYKRYDLDDVRAWVQSCKRPGRPVAFRTATLRNVT